jgi:uncharacterized membrane protein YbaN (DUF454 family)
MILKTTTKIVMMVLGSLALFLGIIGIMIPVLPTTPFLLLAAFFYLRSSENLYGWLINHKTFGSYIHNYMTYRAVKKSTKIGALITLWISLSISIVLVEKFWLKIFLFLIGTAVSIHLLKLRTLEEIQTEELQRELIKEASEG